MILILVQISFFPARCSHQWADEVLPMHLLGGYATGYQSETKLRRKSMVVSLVVQRGEFWPSTYHKKIGFFISKFNDRIDNMLIGLQMI